MKDTKWPKNFQEVTKEKPVWPVHLWEIPSFCFLTNPHQVSTPDLEELYGP